MRYLIHHHPAFPGLLTREDLYLLVERGSVARGDLCTDSLTGRDHTVGEVISGMRPPRARAPARIDRPAYREFRADDPTPETALPKNPSTKPGLKVTPGRTADADGADEDTDDADAVDLDEVDEDLDPDAEDEEADDDSEAEGENDEFDGDGSDPDGEADGGGDADAYTAAGELILYQAHPSWLAQGKALFLVLLLLVATGMLFSLGSDYAVVTLLLAVAVFTLIAIARFTRDYVVTPERVEVIWGLLGRSSREVRICDIRSIDVHKSGLKGLIGLGTVDFSSAAGSAVEVQFRDIREAHEVKQLVRQRQAAAGKT